MSKISASPLYHFLDPFFNPLFTKQNKMEQQKESDLSSSLVLSPPAFPSKAATGTKPH